MRKILLLGACLTALLPTPLLAAQGGWYVGAHGGGSVLMESGNESEGKNFNIQYDPGYTYGGTVGFDLAETYPDIGLGRIELEVGYRTNDLDEFEFGADNGGKLNAVGGGDITVLSAMLNSFGELRDREPWIPYLGGGVGIARLELKDTTVSGQSFADGSDTVFAWQVGGGVGLQVNRHLVLDLGYRYFSALDPSFTDTTGAEFESEYNNHTLLLGARLDF